MFKTNVGGADRIIRILLGIALLAAWFMMPGAGYRWVFIVLGLVALGTGLMSSCPLYSLLGINTCPMKKT
ncbi:MAG: DUF2892 domain-containing protein [Rhodobacteraceae bacterium]|nr:DUF2892 domain-containing protein [Paracoccaceae bacterium]